jgi:ribosomal protein L11 methyltransferase
VAATAVTLAENLLELAGAVSVSLGDAGDDPVLEPAPDTTPLWPNVTVSALFPAAADIGSLCTLLRSACGASDIEIAPLDDAHWQAALRQTVAGRPIGQRAWLGPAEDDSAPVGKLLIRLHMGLAFGTGQHPTTSLCLDWLEAELPAGATVLDYGCGSGVLAIAALMLGADRGWAIDNDPQALEATRANAALNDVTERLFIGAPAELAPLTADVLVANILAGPLIELAPRLATHVRAGGALVLAGILQAQAARVVAAYEPFFTDFALATQQGWALLTATRRSAS